jgi:type II secretory pathway component GspD/PulD (secretin)
MFPRDLPRVLIALSLTALAAACGAPPRAVVVAAPPAPARTTRVITPPLADLPAEEIVVPARPAPAISIERAGEDNRITLVARNANVRDVLPTLASAAGVSLVMSPDVKGRVTLNLRDVPAMEALEAVIEEAGLTTGSNRLIVPYGPVVFYNLPVNVNTASAATIKARFGVQDTTADWVVRARRW